MIISKVQEGFLKLNPNIGVQFLKLPQVILDEVKIKVDEVQNNFSIARPWNSNLVGQINKEYAINHTPTTTNYIKKGVEMYMNTIPTYYTKYSSLFENNQVNLHYEGQAWVNFQEKYEYNPIHNHSGILSYVIWYQIPYYRENEIEQGPGIDLNKKSTNGDFEFYYFDGEKMVAAAMGIDKTKEGYMALFPASLHHEVHPFYTSDDYRITISGNIFLK